MPLNITFWDELETHVAQIEAAADSCEVADVLDIEYNSHFFREENEYEKWYTKPKPYEAPYYTCLMRSPTIDVKPITRGTLRALYNR